MLTRRADAHRTRREVADLVNLRSHPPHLSNGEEQAYRNANGLSYIANFTKGLPHAPNGEVEPAAYRALLRALTSGDHDALERVPTGGPPTTHRPFVNPQAAHAFELEGPDPHAVTQPPAPRIDGPEAAGEMAELYWMALLRDVAFVDYGFDVGSNTTTEAAASLSNDFSVFTGPRDAVGDVTPQTLFRGSTPGDLDGPYVSQFLLRPVVYGTLRFNQRQRTARPGIDYMVNDDEWLAIQDGEQPAATDQFGRVRRYIRNARDLATYVHFDALYQAYLNACLILLGAGAPFDALNSYSDSETQQGFATYGGPHVLGLVTEVATRALKAVWYQKWNVHRRLRPEAFGGLIHHHLQASPPDYPIDEEILDTGAGSVLDRVNAHNQMSGNNTYLLSQAYPEGSPVHPSYGAGHAAVAGACVSVLKACFDESFPIPDPVVPDASGTALTPYVPPPDEAPLTVGGELNKLASNMSIGRNMAGVHWRTDAIEAMRLGEAVAISILEEQQVCFNERDGGFSLTTFDGAGVTI